MVDVDHTDWTLRSGQYLGEISALSFLHLPSSFPYLIAGSGSQILLYNLESGKMIRSFRVFEGIRVHGICCYFLKGCEGSSSSHFHYNLVLFAEKRVKIFSLFVDLRCGSEEEVSVELNLVVSLPRFSHWVLDVSCVKGCLDSRKEGGDYLAIGLSDNSIRIWDIAHSCLLLHVQSPDRCLLYSMRLWGDNLENLHVASGTIYNEIIVWKVVTSLTNTISAHPCFNGSLTNCDRLGLQHYEAVHICRLVGHEGSIFRIVWSSCGTKLVSVSDDRSARIWPVRSQNESEDFQKDSVAVLYGHSARVWDCCISDTLIVTAGEDCTCRVWGLDGKQLEMIKEHVGRGIWRCLYDPNSSLLVTAGFDSAIKVHQLHNSLSLRSEGFAEAQGTRNKVSLPKLQEHTGFMDSNSEYVRCLRFMDETTIYIVTNNGYLYHAKLSETGTVKWSDLFRITEKGPIICMDVLRKTTAHHSCDLDDWVALGDGKGNVTIVRVVGNICSPKVGLKVTWSAGPERQLLGIYWCRSRSSKDMYTFTANPRGELKLWRLLNPLASDSQKLNVTLVAEFSSCFEMRIICLDASFEDEVLVCGDLRGNLVLFPLTKDTVSVSRTSEAKISPLNYFKGGHGISTVTSLSLASLSASQVEIRSTGADGCICYFEYERDAQTLEFMGLKKIKELSMIQSVFTDNHYASSGASYGYIAGFASTDFIVWNLTTETKVLQIPCGGWRRPHSFYIGDVPETKNCFAYVKDDVIYTHRHWVEQSKTNVYPLNLHMQFHGREMHSLCFISENSRDGSNTKQRFSAKSSWIATGCEDGTVRLTKYAHEDENWSTSKLLGEHVGGSAVRSLCFVSDIHVIASDATDLPDKRTGPNAATKDKGNPFLLISVGAKRVLTSWLLRYGRREKELDKEAVHVEQLKGNGNDFKLNSEEMSTSMTFQWLSTDMPSKNCSANGAIENLEHVEDDWRYLAVTAFLVKHAGSKLTICFVVVACSDATLALRALVLPHRLWFDVALLLPLSSPVLTLQHVVIPLPVSPEENNQSSSVYMAISGATDGSIAFWDLTKSVEAFVKQVSSFPVENSIDCQKRPRTGRGSQGGRRRKSLGRNISKKGQGDKEFGYANGTLRKFSDQEIREPGSSQPILPSPHEAEVNITESLSEIHQIQPMHVLSKAHQSGVNCLHVSPLKDYRTAINGLVFNVISGGDDQALTFFNFNLSMLPSDVMNAATESGNAENLLLNGKKQIQNYKIRFLNHEKIASAHSSAVKGVWTDGIWVFSTGLDQRIRCWSVERNGKLIQHSHLITSVLEPEALGAKACGNSAYQIAVAGRGMQIIDFSPSGNSDRTESASS